MGFIIDTRNEDYHNEDYRLTPPELTLNQDDQSWQSHCQVTS